MRIIMSLILCLAILTGCNLSEERNSESSGRTETYQTHNPTAEEILTNDPDADIFQLDGIVYMNSSDIEWVQTKEITADERIGIVAQQYNEKLEFANGMATKLPVGTEIFKPQISYCILIVKLEGEEIRYLGLVEG